MEEVDRVSKQGVLRALKDGVVPEVGLQKIMVGREREVELLKKELSYVSEGGSSIKFLRGEYGSGKTFLSRLAVELALEENFAVSIVDLGFDAKFNKLHNIYNKIMEGLTVRKGGENQGLIQILDSWLEGIEDEISSNRNYHRRTLFARVRSRYSIDQEIEVKLGEIGISKNSFINAVRGYYHACQEENIELANGAVNWLKGARDVPTDIKGEFDVKGSIEKDEVFEYLQSVISLIKDTGYAGLLVIFDEAENMLVYRKDHRNTAYENLRKVVDSLLENKLKQLMMVFAATPPFFSDEKKGIASHQGLYQRVNPVLSTEKDTFVLQINGLTENQLQELSYKIRALHSEVYKWNAAASLDDKVIEKLVAKTVDRFENTLTSPRIFLKKLIAELDQLYQDPEYEIEE